MCRGCVEKAQRKGDEGWRSSRKTRARMARQRVGHQAEEAVMEKPSEAVGAEDAAGELSGRRFFLVSRRCYLTVKYVGGEHPHAPRTALALEPPALRAPPAPPAPPRPPPSARPPPPPRPPRPPRPPAPPAPSARPPAPASGSRCCSHSS